eukprot:3767964-Prymnesium_polylepis.1
MSRSASDDRITSGVSEAMAFRSDASVLREGMRPERSICTCLTSWKSSNVRGYITGRVRLVEIF